PGSAGTSRVLRRCLWSRGHREAVLQGAYLTPGAHLRRAAASISPDVGTGHRFLGHYDDLRACATPADSGNDFDGSAHAHGSHPATAVYGRDVRVHRCPIHVRGDL